MNSKPTASFRSSSGGLGVIHPFYVDNIDKLVADSDIKVLPSSLQLKIRNTTVNGRIRKIKKEDKKKEELVER